MAAVTRLGQPAIGLAAYGTFLPKGAAPAGPHNPGVITRLAITGVMAAKYGTFLPKGDTGGGGGATEFLVRARRRGRR